MKSLIEVLNEGYIGDLKNVRYIRHYTTLRGLANIIQSGYIQAHQSEGDSDWYGYNIGAKKVVSFHDARTDPELKFLIDANEEKYTMQNTNTLGIHMHEICAMIEYNFDILPENIKQCADFIKILEHYVPEFCNLWNEICELKSIPSKQTWKNIKDYEDFYNYIGEVGMTDQYRKLANAYFYVDKFEKDIFFKMLKRSNLKPYSDYEVNALLQAAIEDDRKKVFNILKQHGWKNGDEYCQYIYHFSDWNDHTFLEYLQKRFLGTNDRDINIEIRIACDMPINVRGCTIYFFKGVADKVEEIGDGAISKYNDFLKQLTLMPNVEIYEPGDDYSLIN